MEGGDFSATVSASQSVGPLGYYTWNSVQMVADVQSWVNNPSSNFGWLVLGDESDLGSAKRFDTRESASPPVLTIEYRSGQPSPRPSTHSTAASVGLALFPVRFASRLLMLSFRALCEIWFN